MRVLIAADQPEKANWLREGLRRGGYKAGWAQGGEESLLALSHSSYELILLDIACEEERLAFLRDLRRRGSMLPVLFLTENGRIEEKIAGIDGGADDYLSRPFCWEKLCGQVDYLIQCRRDEKAMFLSYGDVFLDSCTQELCCEDISVRLGFKEYAMMKCLICHGGQILPKKMLWERVWGAAAENHYNNVEVYMSFLRKKLRRLNAQVRIRTLRGRGYRLEQKEKPPPFSMVREWKNTVDR